MMARPTRGLLLPPPRKQRRAPRSRLVYQVWRLPPAARRRHSAARRGIYPFGLSVEFLLRLALTGVLVRLVYHALSEALLVMGRLTFQ